MNFVLRTLASQTQYHDEAIAAAGEHVRCGVLKKNLRGPFHKAEYSNFPKIVNFFLKFLEFNPI